MSRHEWRLSIALVILFAAGNPHARSTRRFYLIRPDDVGHQPQSADGADSVIAADVSAGPRT
jgi:hypothetical protein